MARPSRRLNVFLNSRLVGALTRETSGAIDFRYGADWLSWAHTLPIPLSLPLREDRYTGAPVSNVFDNLLPDHEGLRRAGCRARRGRRRRRLQPLGGAWA